MAVEREEAARELRLEGPGLVAVGAVLVALIGGAFFAGRWFERREHASRAAIAADGPGPLSQVVEIDRAADANADTTYFDRVEGSSQQAEPQRELPSRPSQEGAAEPPPAEAPRTAEPTVPPPATRSTEAATAGESGGSYYVQVFAGHDRSAATKVIDQLTGEGYEVRLFSDGGAGGAILRVRVGGYASEDRARAVAGNLRESGYSDAFVTHVE